MTTSVALDNNDEEEWILAKKGLQLLINNKGKEAEDLFLEYPDSLVMYSGYSFTVFMDALMSFEENKLTKATATLKEVERRCCNKNKGWLKLMKTKVFGGGVREEQTSIAEELETQIILADSQVCLAILIFLQQDISGYFRSGWVLRKAWKVYQSVHEDILTLYNKEIGQFELPAEEFGHTSKEECVYNPIEQEIAKSSPELIDGKAAGKSDGAAEKRPNPSKKTIVRLMNAVCFGYGLFQLGVSLLPPVLLKLTSFLGLSGDRTNGLACLMYSRLGIDMRAPLATLALLWYHTIVRPFYSIDGTNVGAGALAAKCLIQENTEEFSNSSIFLFFKGRLHRLKSEIGEALKAFEQSAELANQQEIKLLAVHEVSWCHLIRIDYNAAEQNFSYLATSSRWSRPFYSYITIVCLGAAARLVDEPTYRDYVTALKSTAKTNALGDFLLRRDALFPERLADAAKLDPVYWKMLVYEMLYLWNALPSCSREALRTIIQDCETVDAATPEKEPMPGISKLIEGCSFSIIGNKLDATKNLEKCIYIRETANLGKNAKDNHVMAFAKYELGSIYYSHLETKEKGKQLLQETNAIKDYDFEQRLTVRVNSLLK